MLDSSEVPLLPGSGAAFRAAWKRKRFRYEENVNRRQPLKSGRSARSRAKRPEGCGLPAL